MRNPEILRAVYEFKPETAIYGDWCLRSINSQAAGREMDPETDSFLLQQISESHVGDTQGGKITGCRVGGCALLCLTTTEQGILELQEELGIALCDPSQD